MGKVVFNNSVSLDGFVAGLLDEIHIDLVPVLLGSGVSLFDRLGSGPIELERMRVVEAVGVTHLAFRVVR